MSDAVSCQQPLLRRERRAQAALRWIFTATLWTLACVASAPAQTPLEIMRRVEKQAESATRQYTGALQVSDRGGKVLRKAWRSWTRGRGADSASLIRFTAPPEVKGVGLLVLSHSQAPSEQWLYTPAIRRDRRIAVQDRSVRFLGTDFSYEDMQEHDVADYEYELLAEEALGGRETYKIKATPHPELKSQYAYFYSWVEKETLVVTLTEFYRKDGLAKVLSARRLERIQGIWTAREMEMKDVRRGSVTVITLADILYNRPLPDDWFTLGNLRNAD